jgi:hypothetical protein
LEFLTNLKLYPNPATNICTLEGDDLSISKIYVLDALGQRVFNFINSRSENSIIFDIDQLKSGMYFVVLEKGEIITTRKLFVE